MLKYNTEVIIHAPLDHVISLFDSFENLSKWQPTLKSYQHLEGEPGHLGAKTRLIYDERGKDMEMIETITKRNLPDEFNAIYTAKGVENIFENHFTEISPSETRYSTLSIFKFKGLMAFMSLFMKKTFAKSTLIGMTMFKEFAEKSAN